MEWAWKWVGGVWICRTSAIGPPEGGADTQPGLRGKQNKNKKAKDIKARERRMEEDAADPAGAAARAQARLLQRQREELWHRIRNEPMQHVEAMVDQRLHEWDEGLLDSSDEDVP